MKRITKIITAIFKKEIVEIEKKEEPRVEEKKGPLYAYRTKK
jgi:hypothetical protein